MEDVEKKSVNMAKNYMKMEELGQFFCDVKNIFSFYLLR